MKGGKFFSVPYDVRHTTKMRFMRLKCGGISAFGRWMALLSILFEHGGAIDLSNEAMHKVIEAELELNAEKLDEFIEAATEIGWIDKALWEKERHVISPGVLDQIEVRKRHSESGKKGAEAKRAGARASA